MSDTTDQTWIPTDDIVRGDTIRYEEAVFSGSWRSAKCIGKRLITARVERESYGEAKQQHTFTITVLECDGTEPIEVGTVTRRKGRNLYKNGPMRLLWEDEVARQSIADEKHRRGMENSFQRELRKQDQRKTVEVWP